jgi:hypothetical protein
VIYSRIGPPKNLVGLAVLALQIARVDWRLPCPLRQCLLARAVLHGEHTSLELVANWFVRGLGASTFVAYPALPLLVGYNSRPQWISAGEVLSARRRLELDRSAKPFWYG